MLKGLLFDLDGVIVDTAKYHYIAWKEIADELDIPFTKKDNERLKGVSRTASFEIILELGGREMTAAEKADYCSKKNEIYLSYIRQMTPEEILPGAADFLIKARRAGLKTALGSASKNSRTILDGLKITELFDAVIDGNMVRHSKPDPEVFLKGAEALGLKPEECLVFEDAYAGIEAAHNGGMKAVGIGSPENLPNADLCIPGLAEADLARLQALLL